MRSSKPTLQGFQQYLHHIGLLSSKPARISLFSKYRFSKFFTQPSEGQKCFTHLLQSLLKPKYSLITKLKLLMAVHHVAMANKPYLQMLVDYSYQLIESVKIDEQTDTGRVLLARMFQIYLQFLLKISSNYENYILVRQRDVRREEKRRVSKRLVINLLRGVIPIKEVLIATGRYYQEEYPIVIDIVETIVKDLVKVYGGLRCLVRICESLNQLPDCSETKQKQREQEQQKIMDQIMLINEDLFVIIYNRYFVKHISVQNMVWVNQEFDDIKGKVERKRSSEIMERRTNTTNVFMENFEISEFEETYFSRCHKTEESEETNEGF